MSYPFRFIRRYTGPLKAAILDWSGTTADKYVLAPAVVFVEVFNKHKVKMLCFIKIVSFYTQSVTPVNMVFG